MFNKVPENVVVCINENKNNNNNHNNNHKNNKIVPELKKKKCVNIDCSDDWQLKQKKKISAVNGYKYYWIK